MVNGQLLTLILINPIPSDGVVYIQSQTIYNNSIITHRPFHGVILEHSTRSTPVLTQEDLLQLQVQNLTLALLKNHSPFYHKPDVAMNLYSIISSQVWYVSRAHSKAVWKKSNLVRVPCPYISDHFSTGLLHTFTCSHIVQGVRIIYST